MLNKEEIKTIQENFRQNVQAKNLSLKSVAPRVKLTKEQKQQLVKKK